MVLSFCNTYYVCGEKVIKDLSIVIPMYKEQNRIVSTLKKIEAYMDIFKIPYEIVVVDDGSTDNSIKIVLDANIKNLRLIQNKTNMGKGYSVKNGILHSRYNHILFTDADLSTPIEELGLFDKYSDNDIVIASRKMKTSNVITKQHFTRQILGRTFPLLVNLLAVKHIKDTQCGFKLFKKEKALEIVKYQTINRFCFDVELLYIAQKRNMSILEIGVTWENSDQSKVDPIKDSLNMLKDLLKIRMNNHRGLYEPRSH